MADPRDPVAQHRGSAVHRSASWPGDLELVRELFGGYRSWLADHGEPERRTGSSVSAGLAIVDALITGLPGAYGPPKGDVLLWQEGRAVVACGGLRELEPGVGEAKRIYVRDDYRGKEFGHPFVNALVDRARELGYRRLRVDTLPTMAAAIAFYQELRFRPIGPYWPHPVGGALFFERDLTR